eukprot:521299-Pyramimonas_sp.AAC.1
MPLVSGALPPLSCDIAALSSSSVTGRDLLRCARCVCWSIPRDGRGVQLGVKICECVRDPLS